MKRMSLIILLSVLIFLTIIFYNIYNKTNLKNLVFEFENQPNQDQQFSFPLFIENLRERKYPESKIVIEETLEPGINYQRYIASYTSDGLKIYGLFTIPELEKPKNGFPAIIFLHGYLPPKEYQTTERYVAYQDGFARNGFITFKPDLRGHGKSEGQPVNSNFSPEYVYDVLNLLAAFKIYPDIDSKRIGMWGHSNGGNLTLRTMVISKDIKAGVIWAGVVGSYDDLLERYRNRIPWLDNRERRNDSTPSAVGFMDYVEKYGSPSATSTFWSKIDPYNYLKDISGPIQLHHGTSDESVPYELSIHLKEALEEEGKKVEYYQYEKADHNLATPAFTPAIERSTDFFKKYL